MRGLKFLIVVVVATTIVPTTIAAQAAVPLELPRTIVFSRTDPAGTHIYAIEPDGTGLAQLTFGPAADVDPAWTADASAITFTRRTATGTDTWIMDPDGSDAHVFLVNARSLVWDYHGDAVAFVRSRNGNDDIWTAAADGSGRVRLTTHAGRDVQPTWTLDGRLSFVSDRSGRDRIYAIELDGTHLTRLTSGPGEQRHPVWWSFELLYEQDDGTDRDIVRMRVSTGSVEIEVGGAADARDPDVALNGELVFRRVRTKGSSVLIHRWIDVSASSMALTGEDLVARNPAWAPAFAWIRAQDDQAKGNLLEAAGTAQALRDDTGSFDADIMEMHAANPTLTYLGAAVDSRTPEEISIGPAGTSWSAAALSDSGTCFYIRLDDVVGTTYGLQSGASAASSCSGNEAAGAQGAAW